MGEPFDERTWRRPNVGDVVAVKCDPGHQKAKFDTSADVVRRRERREAAKLDRAAQAAQFDAMRNAAPGTAAASSVPRRSDRPGSVAAAMAAIARALEAGDRAEAERLRAEFAAGRRASSPAAAQTAGGPGGAGAAPDVLERLEKLADLHDRGALTDAEFAQEKRRSWPSDDARAACGIAATS
jgi:hypothetical protein